MNAKKQFLIEYILIIYIRHTNKEKSKMTFLSLNIEKSYLTIEKTQLEFEEMCISNKLNTITEDLQDYLSEDGADSDDAYAKVLEAQQEQYDSDKESLESRLKVLNTEIESYQKTVETNIKSECKLSISV